MSRPSAGEMLWRPVLVAMSTLALLGACGGDGGSRESRSSSTTEGVGPTSTSPGNPASSEASASSTSTTSALAAEGGSAGDAKPKAVSPATNRPAGVNTAPAPSPFTPPGRYRYASSGTFSAGTTGGQRRSGESILTVDPPAGNDQHSFRQGDGRSIEQILRFQTDGIYIVMLEVTEQGIAKQFRPLAPVLALPSRAPAGRTWSWRMTSTDGKTSLEASFLAERSEQVRVGPETVDTSVVKATLVTTGDVASRGTQTLWVAESRRLVVREESTTDGTFGAFTYRSTAKEELLHLDPS